MKQILSIFLAVVLTVGSLPVSVFAEEQVPETTEASVPETTVETVPETTEETVSETTEETVPETTEKTVPETTEETVPETTEETVPETTEQTDPQKEGSAVQDTALTKAGEIPVDEAHFPDPYFREWVSKNADSDSDGILSQQERDQVQYIEAVGEFDQAGPYKSLQGIEYFPKLEGLFCYGNQLQSLDISKCTALTELYCHDNQLTSLDVSKNTALTAINCRGNQLQSLDVSNCTVLTELYCDDNQLTSLDVSQNTALKELWCGENQLTNLDLSQNARLTELYPDENCRIVKASNGTMKLSSLKGFDLRKASRWTNGTVKNGVLTVKNPSEPVTYNYDCGRGILVKFALKLMVEAKKIPMYRLYNPNTGEHLLVSDEREKGMLLSIGWSLDGTAWYSAAEGAPVTRLYNPADGTHLYTMSNQEISNLKRIGWTVDGVVCYSAEVKNGKPIFRLYNPYAKSHFHVYTADQKEINMLIGTTWWQKEGIAWYAAK